MTHQRRGPDDHYANQRLPADETRFAQRCGRWGWPVGRTHHYANREVLFVGDPLPVRLRRSRVKKAVR